MTTRLYFSYVTLLTSCLLHCFSKTWVLPYMKMTKNRTYIHEVPQSPSLIYFHVFVFCFFVGKDMRTIMFGFRPKTKQVSPSKLFLGRLCSFLFLMWWTTYLSTGLSFEVCWTLWWCSTVVWYFLYDWQLS